MSSQNTHDRYEVLRQRLSAAPQTENELTLNLSTDNELRTSLPLEALHDDGWWANSGEAPARAVWLPLQWQVVQPDVMAGVVRLRRTHGLQQERRNGAPQPVPLNQR